MSHTLEIMHIRKRSGLSQDEMASLLGCEGDTRESRVRTLSRKPGLQTTLWLRDSFWRTLPRSVCRGLGKGREEIKRWAQLPTGISRATPTPMTTPKLEILQAITSGPAIAPANEP